MVYNFGHTNNQDLNYSFHVYSLSIVSASLWLVVDHNGGTFTVPSCFNISPKEVGTCLKIR